MNSKAFTTAYLKRNVPSHPYLWLCASHSTAAAYTRSICARPAAATETAAGEAALLLDSSQAHMQRGGVRHQSAHAMNNTRSTICLLLST